MRTYEIHILRNGRWKIDSVFDDKELALFEAQRMDGSGRYPGVRVIEEAFDEQDTNFSARTIFRGTKASQTSKKASQTSRKASQTSRKASQTNNKDRKVKTQARQEAEMDRRRKSAGDAERRRAQLREARKNAANPYRIISILLLLISLGLGALYALERLRHTL